MNLVNLRKNIIALANLPKCEKTVISAYFDFQQSAAVVKEDFANWVKITRKTFDRNSREQFEQAAASVSRWLAENAGKSRSAAVFSRGGDPAFFLPLTFKVPMESSFQVDMRPAIYPLVEIKDRFNRFVVVLTSRESARILEINLGDTSLEMLTKRPELKERHGREWTREHYLSTSRERDKKFVKEKVGIIEQLMSKRGHNALIVVGEPRYVNRLQDALPKHLREKVVDQIRTGIRDERIHLILEDAIESYLRVEDGESETAVKRLFRYYRTNGLGIFGVETTMAALQIGQVEELIISKSLSYTQKEKLIRLACQHGVPIETVRNSHLLDGQGAVGAILRYATGPLKQNSQTVAA